MKIIKSPNKWCSWWYLDKARSQRDRRPSLDRRVSMLFDAFSPMRLFRCLEFDPFSSLPFCTAHFIAELPRESLVEMLLTGALLLRTFYKLYLFDEFLRGSSWTGPPLNRRFSTLMLVVGSIIPILVYNKRISMIGAVRPGSLMNI